MGEKEVFKGKSVLITGGSGSFGKAFVRRLIVDNQCNKVIIFSRDEWKQWQMRSSDPLFDHPKVRYFIGDVRDLSRLERAFNEVDIVIHAAALKQVPAAEYNPTEFVKTNVTGAQNVIDAAINIGVKKVIALSTDKAVNPVNLYGATKLCSDKLFVAGNSYVGARGYPQFSVVRYGNVLASRGSIVAFWQDLVEAGAAELPVTDLRMTRFWISLDQAVDFVIQCLKDARGGEIYVPKIPSMKITEMAKAIAPSLPLKVVGTRPGEKLHELMIPEELSKNTLEYQGYYIILPDRILSFPELMKDFLLGREATFVPEGFSYTSDKNEKWLTATELKKLLYSV